MAKIIVVGGSNGLGLGAARGLDAAGHQVTIIGRDEGKLAKLAQEFGFKTIAADMGDKARAEEIVRTQSPDAIFFFASVPPKMAPISQISWDDFSVNWEADTKGNLYWIQAALNAPMKMGSRFITISSGAAVNGSPLSGGYGGSKKMGWLMSNYAGQYAAQVNLGLTFQTIIIGQMAPDTPTGVAGSEAYAKALGISANQFLARFGTPLTGAIMGEKMVQLLADDALKNDRAYRLTVDNGFEIIEGPQA